MLSKIVYRISVFALAAAGAVAQSTAIPVVVTHTTGMIGIAEGQTARFNVLNPGVLPPAAGVSCSATLAYFGANGNLLKTASVTVTPGQAQYLDLFGDADLGLMIDQRKQIRATVTIPALVPQPSTGPAGACTLIGTLEILDTLTGRTQAVLGGTHDVAGRAGCCIELVKLRCGTERAVRDRHHCKVIRLPPADQVEGLALDAVQPDPDLPQLGVRGAIGRRIGKIAQAVVAMKLRVPRLERGRFGNFRALGPRRGQPFFDEIPRGGRNRFDLPDSTRVDFKVTLRLVTLAVAGAAGGELQAHFGG